MSLIHLPSFSSWMISVSAIVLPSVLLLRSTPWFMAQAIFLYRHGWLYHRTPFWTMKRGQNCPKIHHVRFLRFHVYLWSAGPFQNVFRFFFIIGVTLVSQTICMVIQSCPTSVDSYAKYRHIFVSFIIVFWTRTAFRRFPWVMSSQKSCFIGALTWIASRSVFVWYFYNFQTCRCDNNRLRTSLFAWQIPRCLHRVFLSVAESHSNAERVCSANMPSPPWS